MLENSFQHQQGCTNHWWQVAWGKHTLCGSALIMLGPQCGTSFISHNWRMEFYGAF